MYKIFKVVSFILLIAVTLACTTNHETKSSAIQSSNIYRYSYGDIEIHYRDIGVGDPIIFIHGLGGDSFTWRYLLDDFSLSNRVICIDLMGFGLSDKPRDESYLVSEQADIISNFIIDKELDDVTLVGNSLGGTICLYSYFDLEERVSAMVLLDPAAYTENKKPAYISILQTPVINKLVFKVGLKGLITKLALNRIVYDNSRITYEMVHNYSRYMGYNDYQNALIKSVQEGSFNEVERISARYQYISKPVLIIFGENDDIIDINNGIRLNNTIKSSQLVLLKDCGHLPQEEFPDETYRIIYDFINKI